MTAEAKSFNEQIIMLANLYYGQSYRDSVSSVTVIEISEHRAVFEVTVSDSINYDAVAETSHPMPVLTRNWGKVANPHITEAIVYNSIKGWRNAIYRVHSAFIVDGMTVKRVAEYLREIGPSGGFSFSDADSSMTVTLGDFIIMKYTPMFDVRVDAMSGEFAGITYLTGTDLDMSQAGWEKVQKTSWEKLKAFAIQHFRK